MLIESYPQQGLPHSTHLAVLALSYPRDQTARVKSATLFLPSWTNILHL
jgi:hypothetical protein